MKRHGTLFAVMIGAVILASMAVAETFTLSNTTKYRDRDGNVYDADARGRVTLPAKYTGDALNAGLPIVPALPFANATSVTSPCTKGEISADRKYVYFCYSTNTRARR